MKGGRILGIEGGELQAVKAHQAAFGRQPQIAIVRLDYGADGVLLKAAFRLPSLALEAGEWFGRIERSYGQSRAAIPATTNRNERIDTIPPYETSN